MQFRKNYSIVCFRKHSKFVSLTMLFNNVHLHLNRRTRLNVHVYVSLRPHVPTRQSKTTPIQRVEDNNYTAFFLNHGFFQHKFFGQSYAMPFHNVNHVTDHQLDYTLEIMYIEIF